MSRFRYRTAALTGPWRESRREAMQDAARAKQAMIDGDDPDSIAWVVPGRIEEVRGAAVPTRAVRG